MPIDFCPSEQKGSAGDPVAGPETRLVKNDYTVGRRGVNASGALGTLDAES